MTNGWTDRLTDRQTDGQGQILMPPDYHHGGIIRKAVILSKLILAPPKTDMHIFNMSTTDMQGFKKIHYKLLEELITQNLYHKAGQTDAQTDRQMEWWQILMPLIIITGALKY